MNTLIGAGAVPQGYFDEVKDGFFGEEGAKKYKEYAEYFSSIVKEGKEDYISKRLIGVFKNPGKQSTYERFFKKLNKNLKPGNSINQTKLTEMLTILAKMGTKLNSKLENQEIALANQDEIIKGLNLKIEKSENERKGLLENKRQREKDKAEREKRMKKLDKKIEGLDKSIIERKERLKKMGIKN